MQREVVEWQRRYEEEGERRVEALDAQWKTAAAASPDAALPALTAFTVNATAAAAPLWWSLLDDLICTYRDGQQLRSPWPAPIQSQAQSLPQLSASPKIEVDSDPIFYPTWSALHTYRRTRPSLSPPLHSPLARPLSSLLCCALLLPGGCVRWATTRRGNPRSCTRTWGQCPLLPIRSSRWTPPQSAEEGRPTPSLPSTQRWGARESGGGGRARRLLTRRSGERRRRQWLRRRGRARNARQRLCSQPPPRPRHWGCSSPSSSYLSSCVWWLSSASERGSDGSGISSAMSITHTSSSPDS